MDNALAMVPAHPQAVNSTQGRFFANPTYHFETLRALGYTTSGGADAGEVLQIVRAVNEGDAQSWYAAWTNTAERVLALADQTQDRQSRGGAFMRAHNYFRTGEFLLPPTDPKRVAAWERTLSAFYNGLDALGTHYERISVPYESGMIRGLYLPGENRNSLIVVVGGFDSILEELYLVLGRAALDRGHSVLLYEGPGQGEPLRKYGLRFTPEWDRPTSAILDEFLRTHDRPATTILIGMSMGGYFAPRAAAFDHRFDGVVSFDTAFDVAEMAASVIGAAKNPRTAKIPGVVWGYDNARWTMGTEGVDETIRAFDSYRLAPVAARITQDVLILAGTEDEFIPFHQTADYERALVNARSVTTRIFDAASGGAEHCQAGALTLVHAAVFDWIADRFANR